MKRSSLHGDRRRAFVRIHRLIACAPLALVACGSQSPEPTRPDVLLITIDTIRADALGCYGRAAARTPNIDRLATLGARFPHAFAPRGATLPSLTTILTGVSPLAHGVDDNENGMLTQQPTLAEILRDHGYATAAFLTNQCVALVEWDNQASRGFDERICARVDGEAQHRWDENATDLAAAWMAHPHDGPILAWVHLMDPHGEHSPDPIRFRGPAPPGELMTDQTATLSRYEVDDVAPPPDILEGLWNLYDAEIAGVDASVGRLYDAIQARRDRPPPIVIVAGDHGEEFYQHNHFRGHADSIYDAVLRIPLILVAPEHVPAAVTPSCFAELEDLLPTILGLLDITPTAPIEGESLLPKIPEHADREQGVGVAFGLWDHEIVTVRTPRWRYIWNHRPGPRDFVEQHAYRNRFDFLNREDLLFDVQSDPEEQRDLLAEPTISERARNAREAMRSLLRGWLAHERHLSVEDLTIEDRQIEDERLREELRQLGY